MDEGKISLSAFPQTKQALIDAKRLHFDDCRLEAGCLRIHHDIELLGNHYRWNEENRDVWISRGCERFFRSRLSGWNCVRNLDRHQHVVQGHFVEIQVHERFCKRQRWLLGCVNDRCAFVIATPFGVETAAAREVAGVLASCQPVNNQANMPWSIRTSSSSTAAGSCVRICKGL